MTTPGYVIVTPARNEGENLRKTIDSVVSQSLRPNAWVLVNDGSSDNTAEIADAAAKQHTWIKTVHRSDRGCRKPGGGVIEAFYDGYKLVELEPWDFLAKLDADLSFGPDYFEQCLARFDAEPKLGVGGGSIYIALDGTEVDDAPNDPPFHVRGATKIYRRACWQAISGLLKAPGWDTLDELKANMLGWKTYSFKDLRVRQLKPTGSADGTWPNWFKNGRANYISGYHPLFMLTKCMRRLFTKPFGIAGVGLLCGFVSGYLKRVPQVADDQLIRYVRQQQMQRLLLRESLWR